MIVLESRGVVLGDLINGLGLDLGESGPQGPSNWNEEDDRNGRDLRGGDTLFIRGML